MKKKKRGLFWILLLSFLLVIVLVVSVLLLKNLKDEVDTYKTLADETQLILDENTKYLYVAMDNLSQGTVLEEDVNVQIQENITGLPEEMYITEEDMGKTLVVDVQAYEPIMASMITEELITKDAREVEIGVATLMLNQQVNDYVDLRIQFPTGADYIIASKLKVNQFDMENSIFYTTLNEAEILTLSSATIDAYTTTGAKIYLTKYVESNMQEEAVPNYPVNETVLSLMSTDPNILEVARNTLNISAREELQGRLALLSEDWFKSVAEGNGVVDTAHASALAAQQAEATLETEVEETNE